jgi:hypothetical protein
MSMYDENPTSSQKMNMISRLLDATIPSIEKVKNPSMAKYRLMSGSPAIYPIE